MSVWLDDLSRERLTAGSLAALRDRVMEAAGISAANIAAAARELRKEGKAVNEN